MTRSVHASIPLCKGQLIAWSVDKVGFDAYYSAPQQTARQTFFVVHECDGLEVQINSLDGLFASIRALGCSPTEDLSREPIETAIIVRFLLNLRGRVIDDPILWGFMDSFNNVESKKLLPAIEGDCLAFSVFYSDISNDIQQLTRLRVHLDSGVVEEEVVDLTRRAANIFSSVVECLYCGATQAMAFHAPIGVLSNELFAVGDVVVKSIPPESTNEYSVGPSIECDWHGSFWAVGLTSCPRCLHNLRASIEIREQRFSAVRPTLDDLDLKSWGPLDH